MVIDVALAGKGIIAGGAKLLARDADELAGLALRQTGAADGWIDNADEAYNAVGTSTTDVDTIARNTGFKQENVQTIKDHLFNNDHILDRYVDYGIPAEIRRSDSNPDIAAAWNRLESGTHIATDIDLLKHEWRKRG